MDAFLLARLARELQEAWGGAWVQQAWQDEGRLLLQLRRSGEGAATRFLLLSAAGVAQGIGTLTARPAVPPRPPALAAYLRAHAVGGRLDFVRCLPFERIVELGISARGALFRLILEATGRRGNLLVTDAEGIVRSAWRWEPEESHPRRPLEPGREYRPPPAAPGLVAPERMTEEAWDACIRRGTPLHRVVAGLGPELGRALSASGWRAFRALVEEYGRRGAVWKYAEGLFPASVARLGEPLGVHADALDAAGAWLEGALSAGADAAAEEAARRRATEHRRKLERRLDKIRGDLARLPDPRALRDRADALAAALWTVPKRAESVKVSSLSGPEETWEIALDPSLSPGENLDRLYERARKAERSRKAAEARLAETAAELERGAPAEGSPGQAEGVAPDRPFRRFKAGNGWAVWVGRNGRENDRLLKEARAWDLWFHVRDAPGAHVLLRLPGREAKVPEAVVLEAAALAAAYSRLSGEHLADVAVLEAGRVRKPKGASPGRVLVAGERTVRVKPAKV